MLLVVKRPPTLFTNNASSLLVIFLLSSNQFSIAEIANLPSGTNLVLDPFPKTLKKFLLLLTPHGRKSAGLLSIMTVIMALLAMIGVASILPFMAVLTNPDIIQTNIILKNMLNDVCDVCMGVDGGQTPANYGSMTLAHISHTW